MNGFNSQRDDKFDECPLCGKQDSVQHCFVDCDETVKAGVNKALHVSLNTRLPIEERVLGVLACCNLIDMREKAKQKITELKQTVDKLRKTAPLPVEQIKTVSEDTDSEYSTDSDTDAEYTKLLNEMKLRNRAVLEECDKLTSAEVGTPNDVHLSLDIDPPSRASVAQSEQKDSSPLYPHLMHVAGQPVRLRPLMICVS